MQTSSPTLFKFWVVGYGVRSLTLSDNITRKNEIKMKNQITIIENKNTGLVVNMKTIVDSKTKESRQVGSVMIQSKHRTGLSRIARMQVRTAFLTLEQDVIDDMELHGELVHGAILDEPGRIVIEETTVPYITKKGKKQDAKINPTTKAVITYQGKPVYRNTYFGSLDTPDVFLRDVATASATAPSTEENNSTPE